MGDTSYTAYSASNPEGTQVRDPWRRLLHAIRQMRRNRLSVRARRVVLLMALVWVVGFYDLLLTLQAVKVYGFYELNPLARQFLHSQSAMIAFKLVLMVPATLIFLIYRRRLLTEISSWFLAATYIVLALRWMACVH